MSAITQEQVRAELSTVKYPGFSRDIISFGLLKDVRVVGQRCAGADDARDR